MDTEFQTVDPQHIALHLPAQLRYLAVIRDAALEVCHRLAMSEFDGYKIEMAVDEACTHVIEHSYHGEPPPDQALDHPGLTVEFFEHPDRLVIDVTDYGDGFAADGMDGERPDPADGGMYEPSLGIYIIRQFVDEVDYRPDPGQGNRLRLTKAR